MKNKLVYIVLFAGFCANMFACSDGKGEALLPEPAPNPTPVPKYTLPKGKLIYIPDELQSNDFTKEESQWSYYRMDYSDNFIVFWEKGFGSNPFTVTDQALRVDIKDLLEKAELFYDVNVNKLKFVETGKSNTDKYRMMIFLKYQSEWLATGSGYDDVVGALWVNPSTCQPVGSTIAHEVGHSFQYQTYCDNPTSGCGWRYGFGENEEGGNCFWEQCAQWQAYQIYHEEQFNNYNFDEYLLSCYKHPLHEAPRYANYFIQDYWCMKHGIEFIGKLWREARRPEDPIEAYQRITGVNQETFNDEMFDAARRFVNWDIDGIKEYGRNYVGRKQCKLIASKDGYYAIDPAECPENYGYNVIVLNVPSAGVKVSADFVGMAGADGYRKKNVDKAGWRYGFVAYLENGSCVYSDIFSEKEGEAIFECPNFCRKLYFVVSGAPTQHWRHAWDDNDMNDEQWPYKVRFSGTNLYGQINVDQDKTPENITLIYDVPVSLSSSDYTSSNVQIELQRLCQSFSLTPGQISDKWGKEIIFAGVNKDGSLNTNSTANEPGHWFDMDGNICVWGERAQIYSELDKDNFIFKVGQYPGHCRTGEKYTIRQCLVYGYETGQKVQATFIFNITIE